VKAGRHRSPYNRGVPGAQPFARIGPSSSAALTLLRLAWPGLLLWLHLVAAVLVQHMSVSAFDSPIALPLLLYVPFLGIAMGLLAVASLLWLVLVWREDDAAPWVRLASAAILIGGVALLGALRPWLD
jgi:hypothetical protein